MFLAPVDPAPAVNVMTAGRSVPMKFSLGGDFGLNILRAGSPAFVPVTCDTGEPVAEVETTAFALPSLEWFILEKVSLATLLRSSAAKAI